MSLIVDTITATSYNLQATDDRKLLKFTAGTTVQVTMPISVGVEGFEVLLFQAGDGQVQVFADVFVEHLDERAPFTARKNATISLICTEDDKFKVSGELASAAFLSLINLAGGAAPGITDDVTDGYSIGSTWFWGTNIYDCTDASSGSANWVLRVTTLAGGLTEVLTFGGGATGEVATITFANGLATAKSLVP